MQTIEQIRKKSKYKDKSYEFMIKITQPPPFFSHARYNSNIMKDK